MSEYILTLVWNDDSGHPEVYPMLLNDHDSALVAWLNEKTIMNPSPTFTKIIEPGEDHE